MSTSSIGERNQISIPEKVVSKSGNPGPGPVPKTGPKFVFSLLHL